MFDETVIETTDTTKGDVVWNSLCHFNEEVNHTDNCAATVP
jgi:hypothetical protein